MYALTATAQPPLKRRQPQTTGAPVGCARRRKAWHLLILLRAYDVTWLPGFGKERWESHLLCNGRLIFYVHELDESCAILFLRERRRLWLRRRRVVDVTPWEHWRDARAN